LEEEGSLPSPKFLKKEGFPSSRKNNFLGERNLLNKENKGGLTKKFKNKERISKDLAFQS